MINQIYKHPTTIDRFHATPEVGPYLDRFTAKLLDAGYQEGSVRDYIRAALVHEPGLTPVPVFAQSLGR